MIQASSPLETAKSSHSVSDHLMSDGLSLELTPLIDIVFMVIVFLLVTANAPLLKLPVNVPQPESTERIEQANPMDVVISIHASAPFWGIDKKQYFTWSEFKSALLLKVDAASAPEHSDAQARLPQVSIASDKAAKADDLVKVMALLNQLNISDAQILMSAD